MTAPKGFALKIKPTILSDIPFSSAKVGKNGVIMEIDKLKIKKLKERTPNI
jgi:hypothetical protein